MFEVREEDKYNDRHVGLVLLGFVQSSLAYILYSTFVHIVFLYIYGEPYPLWIGSWLGDRLGSDSSESSIGVCRREFR